MKGAVEQGVEIAAVRHRAVTLLASFKYLEIHRSNVHLIQFYVTRIEHLTLININCPKMLLTMSLKCRSTSSG